MDRAEPQPLLSEPPSYESIDMAQFSRAFDVPLGPYTIYDPKTGIYASRLPPPQIPTQSVYQFCLGDVSFDDARTAITDCSTGRSIS